jgi:hypothetical protein
MPKFVTSGQMPVLKQQMYPPVTDFLITLAFGTYLDIVTERIVQYSDLLFIPENSIHTTICKPKISQGTICPKY